MLAPANTKTVTRRRKAKTSLPLSREEFGLLRQQADAGDTDAQAKLRKLMDTQPSLLKALGDVAMHAEMNMVRILAGESWSLAEAVRLEMAQLRQQLISADPTPLEELAVRRVVACWLHLQVAENKCGEGVLDKRWLRWHDQAQRHYHAAVKSLLMIQALAAGLLGTMPPRKSRRGQKAAPTRAAGERTNQTARALVVPAGVDEPARPQQPARRLAALRAVADADIVDVEPELGTH